MNPKLLHGKTAHHFNEIDFIKASAIVAVIILHSLPAPMLYTIFAPFHIWHAVPIFLVIAGMNSSLSRAGTGKFVFLKEYASEKLVKYFQKIIVPFVIIWLFEIVVMACTKKITPGKIVYTFFAGGMGPGSYFTPVFMQHLMIFPVILWIKNKLPLHNQYAIAGCFLLISLLLEWMCIVLAVPEWLYRLLYVRYLFAAFLGSCLVSYGFGKAMMLLLTVSGIAYIGCVSYCKFNLPIMYPSWGFQHAPAYFYTVFLIFCLWHLYPFFQRLDTVIILIGKATYHIFLLQMVWFKMAAHAVQGFIPHVSIYVMINVGICLLLGCLFFNLQQYGLKRLRAHAKGKNNG